MDLLLDTSTNDLVFVNGKTTVTRTQSEIVAQRLKIKLYTFLGEWFLDTTLGVPYFQQIFGKQRSKTTVDVIFQNIIAQDEGVIEIRSFESTLDSAGRGYSMSFTVRVLDNSVIDLNLSVGL